MKKNKLIQFGENVEGYAVPVLNEREIRASAGILFFTLFLSLVQIIYKGDFLLVKYVIVIFLSDFIIRIFISPRFSPVLIIGRLIVSRQQPEYVAAAQKAFAWKIGLSLSSLMFFLLVVMNTFSIFTGVTCLLCLVFLFFESAFGICLGCVVYRWFYKELQLCPGNTCDDQKRTGIRISPLQVLIVLTCVIYILLLFFFLNDSFRSAPKNLMEILKG